MKPQRIYLQAPNPGTEQHFFSIRKRYCKNSLHWHDYYELEYIAKGSGTQVSDVNLLLKQFEQMQKMMKQFAGGGASMRRFKKKKKRK